MNIPFASLLASASKKLLPLATQKAAVERSQPFFCYFGFLDFYSVPCINPRM